MQNYKDGRVNLEEKKPYENLNKETTFQIDYVHPFKKEGTVLEAGAKSILRDINSDYRFSILDPGSGDYIPDPSRSNIFDYRQDDYASYTTFAFLIGEKYGLTLGAIGVHTINDGNFVPTCPRL